MSLSEVIRFISPTFFARVRVRAGARVRVRAKGRVRVRAKVIRLG